MGFLVYRPRLARGHFAVRSGRDAAEYLRAKLKPLPDAEVLVDDRLWTWMTAYYWDSICPSVKGGRVVKNSYYYIFEPTNALHSYRHLLFLPWYIYYLAPYHNRMFLDLPLAVLDNVTEETLKRLYLTRIPCIFEVLDRVYWDPKKGRSRPGIVTHSKVKPGDLSTRLPTKIRQLERTFDLQSLNADQLLELLGPEFALPKE